MVVLGPEMLVRRMCECAQESLARYTEADLDRFGFEAGMAIEMAAQAILASHHLSLIVDHRSVDSLFQAAGVRGGKQPPGHLRTIGCEEALKRVMHLHPEWQSHHGKLSLLVECRNGYVHMGTGDDSMVRSALTTYIEALWVMSSHLEVASETVFGPYVHLAQSLRTEAVESVRSRVFARVARARDAYSRGYGLLALEVRQAVISTVTAAYRPAKYEETIVTCPACENPAMMSGTYEVGDWEVDSYDDEGNPDGAYLNVTLYGQALHCGVCSLHLEGRQELDAAEVETEVPVEDVDPGDFYEPDYDDDPF